MNYSTHIIEKVKEEFRNNLFNKNNMMYERTQQIYKMIPDIKKIDDELSAFGLQLTKTVMQGKNSVRALEKMQRETLKLNVKKFELLSKNGYPPDFLEIKYDCDVCKDEGIVEGKRCSCFTERLKVEAFKAANLPVLMDSQSFDTFNLEFYPDDDGTPSSRKIMTYVLKICSDYSKGFGKDSKNLLFTGGTGLGKTFLSSCIAKDVINAGFNVYYQPSYKIFPLFEQTRFSQQPDENLKMQIDFIKNSDLLIIDDLGTELVTTYTAEVLFDLVNTRLNENKKTIISTNLSLDEIRELYSERVSSRIAGNYLVLKFAGNDIRLI